MEFIKTNFFDGPVMGKYRYTFSYDYDSDTVFNTPSTYDPVSNRWFSEFGYTYCTERGLSLAFDGDDMDMYWFWQKHHKDHIRETYYHWTYQDDAMTEVNITYTIYADSYCSFPVLKLDRNTGRTLAGVFFRDQAAVSSLPGILLL